MRPWIVIRELLCLAAANKRQFGWARGGPGIAIAIAIMDGWMADVYNNNVRMLDDVGCPSHLTVHLDSSTAGMTFRMPLASMQSDR